METILSLILVCPLIPYVAPLPSDILTCTRIVNNAYTFCHAFVAEYFDDIRELGRWVANQVENDVIN